MKRVKNLKISHDNEGRETKVSFDFYNQNICEAMIFRQAIMYIPKSFAISEIIFYDDNMIMYREQLAQRLGLLFIDNDAMHLENEEDEFRVKFKISGRDLGARGEKFVFLKASDIKDLIFVYDSEIIPLFENNFIDIEILVRKGMGTRFEKYSFYINHVNIIDNDSHYENSEIIDSFSKLLIDNDNPGEELENENGILLKLTFNGKRLIMSSDIKEVNFIGSFLLFDLDIDEHITIEIDIVSMPTHAKWIPVIIAPVVTPDELNIHFEFMPTGVISTMSILNQVEEYMDKRKGNFDITCFYRQNKL